MSEHQLETQAEGRAFIFRLIEVVQYIGGNEKGDYISCKLQTSLMQKIPQMKYTAKIGTATKKFI
jgi:ribosomal protein L21E